ncbi:hypothetical protein [Paenibacillus spongiae]|nr:hypothetical protein [Paenibacillus spongiae]
MHRARSSLDCPLTFRVLSIAAANRQRAGILRFVEQPGELRT